MAKAKRFSPFFVPPSAWGLLAGALVGFAINVLTSLRFSESLAEEGWLWASFGLTMISAGFVSWISVRLEDLRAEGGKEYVAKIRSKSPALRLAATSAALTIGGGVVTFIKA